MYYRLIPINARPYDQFLGCPRGINRIKWQVMTIDEKREAIRLAELAEIERQTRLREQPDPFRQEAHVDPATPTRLATFADDAEAGGGHAPAAGATAGSARHTGAAAGD